MTTSRLPGPPGILPGLPNAMAFLLTLLDERHPDGHGVKEFLRILTLKDQEGEERLSRALELALQYRCVAFIVLGPPPAPSDGEHLAASSSSGPGVSGTDGSQGPLG